MNDFKVNDKVVITDGSSDGHTGTVIAVHKTYCRVLRHDNVEVDVSKMNLATIMDKIAQLDQEMGLQ